MPYCPSCRGEFREGFEWCDRCRQALVAELEPDLTDPDEMARRLAGRDVVPLLAGPLLDLKTLRDELGRARIPCVIGPPPDQDARSTGSCTPRLVLYVASEEVDRARSCLELQADDLYDAGREAAPDLQEGSDRCPACGSNLGGREACPECGLFLGG